MKVLELIEQFEDRLEKISTVPLTGKILIDKAEISTFLEEIHLFMPEDVKHAKWIKEERQKILEEANKEADALLRGAKGEERNILEKANKEQEMLVDNHKIVELANMKAQEIILKAHAEAAQIKDNSLEYADEILKDLIISLNKTMNTLDNNRKELSGFKRK
jgi:vacuolar-type H+-ATPase subunit H